MKLSLPHIIGAASLALAAQYTQASDHLMAPEPITLSHAEIKALCVATNQKSGLIMNNGQELCEISLDGGKTWKNILEISLASFLLAGSAYMIRRKYKTEKAINTNNTLEEDTDWIIQDFQWINNTGWTEGKEENINLKNDIENYLNGLWIIYTNQKDEDDHFGIHYLFTIDNSEYKLKLANLIGKFSIIKNSDNHVNIDSDNWVSIAEIKSIIAEEISGSSHSKTDSTVEPHSEVNISLEEAIPSWDLDSNIIERSGQKIDISWSKHDIDRSILEKIAPDTEIPVLSDVITTGNDIQWINWDVQRLSDSIDFDLSDTPSLINTAPDLGGLDTPTLKAIADQKQADKHELDRRALKIDKHLTNNEKNKKSKLHLLTKTPEKLEQELMAICKRITEIFKSMELFQDNAPDVIYRENRDEYAEEYIGSYFGKKKYIIKAYQHKNDLNAKFTLVIPDQEPVQFFKPTEFFEYMIEVSKKKYITILANIQK